MFYTVRHLTIFHYSDFISESMMELRMQPQHDTFQQCLNFQIVISPQARLSHYRDHLGNIVHVFNIHQDHIRLAITTEATLEIVASVFLPRCLPISAWAILKHPNLQIENFDFLHHGILTQPTPLVERLINNWFLDTFDGDPLTLLYKINNMVYNTFDYMPNTTDVHSTIDDTLRTRQGVCQDFAHVMLAVVRRFGIPCRYVSGYLFHRREEDQSQSDASHAWVEAWLPELGWVGFDPTNNLVCGERHIRVAIGRDYADVPPTRGVFRGVAETELAVQVEVKQISAPPIREAPLVSPVNWSLSIQQQQQQQ